MKFAISRTQAYVAHELQKICQVTLISNKGLVFLQRANWDRICSLIADTDANIIGSHVHNSLMDNFNLWSECFIVAYDSSEDYSCHGICNFDLFNLICSRLGIQTVLIPYGYNLVQYIHEFNAHENNEVFGSYIESRDDVIEVEDA